MFDPFIAPSGTLLGLLQRGRGDGTLHALAAPRPEALAALNHCVVSDPRHDWQVENRSLYYARLYLDLDGGIEEIERHLADPDDHIDTDDSRTGLALSVLGHLASYGRDDALALLRRYAATGANWAWALDELALRDDDSRPALPRAARPRPLPGHRPGLGRPRRRRTGLLRAAPLAAVGRRPARGGRRPGQGHAANRARSTDGNARCAPGVPAPAGVSRPSSTGPSKPWNAAVNCTSPQPAASPPSPDPTTCP